MSLNCDFCERREDEVEHLIAAPKFVYICDKCVELAYKIIEEEKEKLKNKDGKDGK